MRRWAAALAGALTLTLAPLAQAKPQLNAGWETGVCGASDSLGLTGLGWCNAIRADLLLLRERSRGFDLGPSLRLGSASFDDVRLDAGLTLLLPVTESFPVLLEAGPHLRKFSEAGVFGSVFFGLRSFNHYGSYEMSTGLVVLAQRSFAEGTPSALWIAARIDGAWLTLPFVLAANALR